MITSNGYQLKDSADRLGLLEPVPADDRDNRDALWARLRRDGYLYLTEHLPEAVVLDFREFYFSRLVHTGLLSADSDPADGIGSSGAVDSRELRRVIFDEIVPSEEYEALVKHPLIRDWFAWFFEDEAHLHRRQIIRHTRAGESGIGTATQAHYDLVYLREGTDRVLSMWIPLGACPRERGGLMYLEKSHHRVLRDEHEGRLLRPAASITADLPMLAERFDARWLIADYAPGDVVVHSAHIVHASGDNMDSASLMRLSTDIRYQRASDPIDWRWQQYWREDDGL